MIFCVYDGIDFHLYAFGVFEILQGLHCVRRCLQGEKIKNTKKEQERRDKLADRQTDRQTRQTDRKQKHIWGERERARDGWMERERER